MGVRQPTSQLRALAEAHVARYVSKPPWPPGSYEADHVEEIVARALAALDGSEDPPRRHSHAGEEMGVCTDCDATVVLEEFDARYGDPKPGDTA